MSRRRADTPLTLRQIKVLRLIAKGCCNEEIAAALTISTSTVDNHIQAIMDKLCLRRRTQLAVYAVKAGLIGLDEIELPGSTPDNTKSTVTQRDTADLRTVAMRVYCIEYHAMSLVSNNAKKLNEDDSVQLLSILLDTLAIRQALGFGVDPEMQSILSDRDIKKAQKMILKNQQGGSKNADTDHRATTD